MTIAGWWFEPLWKIWKSIGMILFPIYGNMRNGNQTTNQDSIINSVFQAPLAGLGDLGPAPLHLPASVWPTVTRSPTWSASELINHGNLDVDKSCGMESNKSRIYLDLSYCNPIHCFLWFLGTSKDIFEERKGNFWFNFFLYFCFIILIVLTIIFNVSVLTDLYGRFVFCGICFGCIFSFFGNTRFLNIPR